MSACIKKGGDIRRIIRDTGKVLHNDPHAVRAGHVKWFIAGVLSCAAVACICAAVKHVYEMDDSWLDDLDDGDVFDDGFYEDQPSENDGEHE